MKIQQYIIEGRGKSSLAIIAESHGYFSVTTISKQLKIPSKLIKKFVPIYKQFRTGLWGRRTNYYSLRQTKEIFGIVPSLQYNGEAKVSLMVEKPSYFG
jgi:hypothetical protein